MWRRYNKERLDGFAEKSRMSELKSGKNCIEQNCEFLNIFFCIYDTFVLVTRK